MIHRSLPRSGLLVLVALVLSANAWDGGAPADVPDSAPFTREEPFVERPFVPFSGDRWIGDAVAYGPHRDGQRPGGLSPTRDQLREDLGILSAHWNLLRVYGASGFAGTMLELIREEQLDLKVMLGVWIAAEAGPAEREANRLEVEAGVRLAAEYPEIVIALCAGNETQVSWSPYPVPAELLITTVRELRARAAVPVTTADDFNFWNKPESRAVAREIDFIVMHAHPLWNGIQLEDAVDWTRRTVAEIRAAHPGRTVVLGETGWATRRHTEGDQAKLMKGRLGEAEQATFLRALRVWLGEERVTTFLFEAFDENWKGGDHPDEVEKHWGVFRADRTPKRALAGGR